MSCVADITKYSSLLSETCQSDVMRTIQAMLFAQEHSNDDHDWIPLDPDQKEWKQEEAKKLREE